MATGKKDLPEKFSVIAHFRVIHFFPNLFVYMSGVYH